MPVTHESFCSPRPSASASPYTVYNIVVGWPEGVAPSGSRRSRRDNLSSPGSCHPDHQEPCAHAQWAKSRGYWLVMRCQQAAAFFMVHNRLYFLRTHRIR